MHNIANFNAGETLANRDPNRYQMFNLKFLLTSVFYTVTLLTLTVTTQSYAQNAKMDSLTSVLKSHPQQDDLRAKLLLNLATEGMKFDPKQALPQVDEVISFQNNIKEKNYVSGAYRTKGSILIYLSKFPEALEAFTNALTTDKARKNEAGVAAALGNIGMVYMTQGKFAESLKYFLPALKKHEEVKNELNAGITLMNIGIVYTEMQDYDTAMKNYQKALPVFAKYKHYVGQAHVLTNIGILKMKTKNIKEAIKYSKLSLQIADSAGDLRISARENGNLAAYYSQIHEVDLSLMHGKKAIEKNKKINNTKSLGTNYLNFSDAYAQKKDYVLAKSYGLDALKIGMETDVADLKRDASLGLSEIYTALGMPDSAFFHYKKYKEFGDSISNDQKKNEITRMSLKYEFDKTEAVYREKQLLAEGQLKQQQLQLALNRAELQKGLQRNDLQKALLENEKLIGEEKQKQLLISKNNEKLQASKLNAL